MSFPASQDMQVEPGACREAAASRDGHSAPASELERIPLSYPQQRLWFLEQLHPGTAAYAVPFLLRLNGHLKCEMLERSLAIVTQRHEILRTRFGATDGEPWQEPAVLEPEPLPLIDLSSVPGGARELELRRLAQAAASRPFDLGRGLNVRWTLYRLAPCDHALLVVMHHIASDAASIGIFVDELAICYESLTNGSPPDLPALPIQYADFAAWQLNDPAAASVEDTNYWVQQLAGCPSVMPWPADHARPPLPSFQGGRCECVISPELSGALKRLSMAEGVTPFMLMLAAFKTFLFRLTGSNDLLVGAPITLRQGNGTSQLIGFFSNTIVLRSRPSGELRFREFLKQVRTAALEGYTHKDLPFEKLVESLPLDRKLNHSPLFQTMFVLQPPYARSSNFAGLEANLEIVHSGSAKFDLTLEVEARPTGWRVSAEYSVDLFERPSIERWLGHFQILLEDIVASPEKCLSDLALLSPANALQQLEDWNATASDYPRGQCIHGWFEQKTREMPGAVALEFGGECVSYRELNLRANAIAEHLIRREVPCGSLVAICAPPGIEMISGMLGILKAGAAYLPIDSNLPEQRIGIMLQDAQVPLVLVTPETASLFRNVDTVCLKSISTSRNGSIAAISLPMPQVSSENVAYAIYTSGSTGLPKGVLVPHRAVMRLVLNTNYIQLTPRDRVAHISNSSFDAATFEIWGALLNGARLVGIERDVVLSPHEFAGELRRKAISALFLTTSLFNQIASEAPDAFEGISNVLFGGEAADPTAVQAVLRAGAPRRLLNVYGPTENTTFSTWYEIKQAESDRPIPIGRPISNSESYVLGEDMKPVPIGAAAELYVGGDGLAVGYLNRPEFTRERFVPHPFQSGKRLYRTGDQVRCLPDGNIQFLGRLDQQVKIRGFRVEPGEIEASLLKHPHVLQCAVIPREEASGVKQLLAYVAGRNGTRPDPEMLREFLEQQLPAYMIPARFIVQDHLPLSATGKIDRSALPSGPRLSTPSANPHEPVVSPLERQLQGIWQDVLQLPHVGVRDRFFAIGGHSLLAAKVVSRIEQSLKKRLTIAELFQHPSIEKLAAHLRNAGASSDASAIVEIQGSGSKPPLFLVHGVGGGMLWGYGNLARRLGNDFPVYAFQVLDQNPEMDMTIERLAEKYLADLRKAQPDGPYYLGGYCFGGVIAYEMARQLHEQHQPVAEVILFNSCPPNSTYTNPEVTPEFAVRLVWNAIRRTASLFNLSREQRLRFMQWKARSILSQLSHSTGNRNKEASIERAIDLQGIPAHEQKLWLAHLSALKCYHPKPFKGHITLYRNPLHLLFCSFDPSYGWNQFAPGRVTVKVCSGRHETIMQEPAVNEVADHLKLVLANASRNVSQNSSTLLAGEALA